MNNKDLQKRLRQSKEYIQAKNELKLNFDFANAVLEARINRNWSQGDLAEAIGTKQANISRIEAAQANPTLNFIGKISRILDLEIIIKNKNQFTYSLTFEGFIANDVGCINTNKLDELETPIPECFLQWQRNFESSISEGVL